MKAMVLAQHGNIDTSPLVLQEMPKPVPKPGDIRIRISCCAICRTDLHVIEKELPPRTLPIIPGHQIVGTVDEPGPGSHRFKPGQLVGVAWLHETCGHCEFCRSGRENLCDTPTFTGYHVNGGFAEYCLAREDFAYEIPAGFSAVEAAPLLCAGIIGYRSLKRSELPARGTLGIFGFGSAAHVIIQIAKSRGSKVFVVTRDRKHQDFAREMGADWAGGSIANIPKRVDSAIIFAPAGELVPDALTITAKGGTVALAGIHMSPVPTLDYEKHLFYERTLRSVTANTRQDGQEFLREASQAGIHPQTTVYPLELANQALQDLKHDRISGTGVLLIQG